MHVLVDYSSKLILYVEHLCSVCATQTDGIMLDIDIVLRWALVYAALCVSAFHFVLCLVCGIVYSVYGWLAAMKRFVRSFDCYCLLSATWCHLH